MFFFIPGEQGNLYAIYYPPVSGASATQILLHIPAFAEEMNKSRRMVALQAREFARHDYGVLVIDLFGTGDSQGDFSDASWSLWKQSLTEICAQLLQQGFNVSFWALRSGALLALDVAEHAQLPLKNLLTLTAMESEAKAVSPR